MWAWWSRLSGQWRATRQAQALQRRPISDALWHSTIAALPFIHTLGAPDLQRLRQLASLFLDRKEFSGAQGWVVTDAQAVMVATQACLPILHIAAPERPDLALRWYGGFVGIVLHAGEVRARRSEQDETGVVHHWQEDLTGETLQGGPLMLAWSDVANAGHSARESYNVVVHEFIHVMDLQDGMADGCPPMPAGARNTWLATLQAEYATFCEQTVLWERFGTLAGHAPLLDAYGSTSIDEFFAVAAEAYFVRRSDFASAHPRLLAQFDGFFIHRPST
ncbi:MAG: M90 family metallopeptidase [Burkholderiaceae bacterium]